MFFEKTAIANASKELQEAFQNESSTGEQVRQAFENLGNAIAQAVRDEYESANGDKQILLQRGFRVLTSEENKFYQRMIEAGKKGSIQEVNGILGTEIMPQTILEDIYKNIKEEHPLLAAINFQSVKYLTRWVLNDHSEDTAVWGAINSTITKKIDSAFRTVEMTQCKLTAYAQIELDMLDLGPVFLDNYIRTYLAESVAIALETGIVSGSGHNAPIGMDRDIHMGVTINSSTGYPQKTAVELASFTPADYGAVLAALAVTEVWYTDDDDDSVVPASTALDSDGKLKTGYTMHGGAQRMFDEVTLICNQVDYLTKVMPASTVLNAAGMYVGNVFPFPTKVVRARIETGKAILVLPKEYFFGIGTSKAGVITASDEYAFLDDKRTFKIKMHGMGRCCDDTCAVLLDISDLESAYIWTKNINVDVDVEVPGEDAGGSGAGGAAG